MSNYAGQNPRIIDGKKYMLSATRPTKVEAEQWAKGERASGKLVRIFKIKGYPGSKGVYGIYVHFGRK